MKILSCHLENFASYKELDLTFNSNGLTLISGPTGAGKSTLCDAIPWILFGKTAKGGTVDEVLSWQGGVTSGIINLDGRHSIHRCRGKNPKYNDLSICYWTESGPIEKRGKDLNDTQKIINNLLGMDIDLYLSGAYFHEFSQSAQFFTTTAKNRRNICEQIVDLSLPKKLQEKTSLSTKEYNKESEALKNKIVLLEANIVTFEHLIKKETANITLWHKNQETKKRVLIDRDNRFEEEKQLKLNRLESLQNKLETNPISYYDDKLAQLQSDIPPQLEVCKTCGESKFTGKHSLINSEIAKIQREKSENAFNIQAKLSFANSIMSATLEQNPYKDQILELDNEVCQHGETIKELTEELSTNENLLGLAKMKLSSLKTNLADLELLSEVVQDFRGALIKNTIIYIENQTNTLLNDHFDGEIRIELIVQDADKLEVTITKDGNQCSYTQLSKGQRQMLKLCFGVSVMKAVANHHGLSFNQAYFDESLDGLDENMKLKALGLLEKLALDYETVYLVDHSEAIKAMVNNKIEVKLVNGHSEICQP